MIRFIDRLLLIIVGILFVSMMINACGDNTSSNNDNDGNEESTDGQNNGTDNSEEDEISNENPMEIINEKILPDNNYEVHYFAQWEMGIDYPYDNVDEYWEEMHDIGYFKFFYDNDNRIIQHVRYQEERPQRIAFYDYSDDKQIKWTKNYDYKTGKHSEYDILTYYPTGRIKNFTEYKVNDNGEDKVIMKVEYTQIKLEEDTPKNIIRYYNSEEKEMMYAETEYHKNNYSDYPEYLKSLETRYVAFGEYKDKWFSITRYNDAGEVIQIQENEMEAEEGLILPDYMYREFPEYFSTKTSNS